MQLDEIIRGKLCVHDELCTVTVKVSNRGSRSVDVSILLWARDSPVQLVDGNFVDF